MFIKFGSRQGSDTLFSTSTNLWPKDVKFVNIHEAIPHSCFLRSSVKSSAFYLFVFPDVTFAGKSNFLSIVGFEKVDVRYHLKQLQSF